MCQIETSSTASRAALPRERVEGDYLRGTGAFGREREESIVCADVEDALACKVSRKDEMREFLRAVIGSGCRNALAEVD